MTAHTAVTYKGFHLHCADDLKLPIVTKTLDDLPPQFFRPDVWGGFKWGNMGDKAFRLSRALLFDVFDDHLSDNFADQLHSLVVHYLPSSWVIRADALEEWARQLDETGHATPYIAMPGMHELRFPNIFELLPGGALPAAWIADQD